MLRTIFLPCWEKGQGLPLRDIPFRIKTTNVGPNPYFIWAERAKVDYGLDG